MEEIVKIVEAVMFALGREVTLQELSDTLKFDKEDVIKALDSLKEKYNKNNGVVLVEVKNAYQLVSNKDCYKYINKFIENTKRQNLSNAALETLSIIAYNPKITKSEIESIRGVNSDFAVNRLLECGLVEEVARLNLPGRPAAYSVTNEFLRSCGIKDIDELPDFENIRIKDEQLLVSDFEDNKVNEDEDDKNNENKE